MKRENDGLRVSAVSVRAREFRRVAVRSENLLERARTLPILAVSSRALLRFRARRALAAADGQGVVELCEAGCAVGAEVAMGS